MTNKRRFNPPAKKPNVLRLLSSGVLWFALAGGLGLTLLVIRMASIERQGSTGEAVQQPNVARQHAPKRELLTVHKPVNREDDFEDLFATKREVDKQADQFARRLIDSLNPHDAAHVATLRQVYSTGQFLRELQKWLDNPSNRNAATSRDRSELAELVRQWNDWERLIARLPQDPP